MKPSITPLTIAHPRGVLVVTTALFVTLALLAALAGVTRVDTTVRDALLSVESARVIAVMHVFNHAGEWRLLLPGTLLLIAFPRARERWWLWVVLMVAGMALPDILKLVVGRPRPESPSLGFPSGHSTAAATFFGALAYLAGSLRRPLAPIVRVVAVLMIPLVGIARVMLRVHWPSDVLGGFALGLALVSAAALIDAARVSTPSAAPARAPRGS